MNIYLARNVVIILLISGTLITSIAVTGQTFATTIGKPDVGIDDGLTTEGEGAEDEETTDEDGDETTSERIVPSKDRFCKQGTGGDTGKPCIPCDPGLPLPGCLDVTTGEPLILGDAEQEIPESEKNKAIQGLKDLQFLQSLEDTDSATERVEIIFKKLEDKGSVPLQTTQMFNSFLKGDTSAYTLCKKISEGTFVNIGSNDCDALQVQGGSANTGTSANVVGAFFLGWIAGEALNAVLKDAGIDVTAPVKFTCQSVGLVGTWPNGSKPQ